jgi:hypothetical protein
MLDGLRKIAINKRAEEKQIRRDYEVKRSTLVLLKLVASDQRKM